MVDSSQRLGVVPDFWKGVLGQQHGPDGQVNGRLLFSSAVNQKKCQSLRGTRLPGPELELSKLRTSATRTAPNPYYCQVGLSPAQAWPLPRGLTEVSPANVTLLR